METANITADIRGTDIVRRACEIRDRLRNPPNATIDYPIDLKNKQARPASVAQLLEEMAEVDRQIIELRSQIEDRRSARARLQSILLRRQSPSEQIKKLVAEHFNVKLSEMMSERRGAEIVLPRQVCQYIIKETTGYSLPKIGRLFGGKDHTTILHAVKKVERLMSEDAALAAQVQALITRVCDLQTIPPEHKTVLVDSDTEAS